MKKVAIAMIAIVMSAGVYSGLVFANSNVYSVEVNYNLSVEELLASGKYDWADEHVSSKNFSSSRAGVHQVNFELIYYDEPISSEDAIKDFKRSGLRPADIKELLAFGAAYPEMQRQFQIVALGSIWRPSWRDEKHIPILWEEKNGSRYSSVSFFKYSWRDHHRLLAVRK